VKLTAIILLLVACASLNAQERRPNIILMYTDDQPENCLGVMGNLYIQTPNLDRLAQRGTLFNNAFVTTAICCCNRACILTGQHMVRHGIRDFIEPLSSEAFDQTYPAILRKAGYRTGFLGKYAIGNPGKSSRELSLPAAKFDLWYGFDQGINFRQDIDGKPRYLTDVMTEKAIEFLQSHKQEKPFCLTLAFKEPHGPFNYFDPNVPDPYESADLPLSPTCTEEDFAAQPEFIRKSLGADGSQKRLKRDAGSQSEMKTAYRLITRADQAVGKILGELDPRVDQKLAGTRRDEMVLSIDLAPTLLALAGLVAPQSMQGKSMVPMVKNESVSWRQHFYYEHTYQTERPRSPIPKTEGIRTTRWKYIRYPTLYLWLSSCLTWKMIRLNERTWLRSRSTRSD